MGKSQRFSCEDSAPPIKVRVAAVVDARHVRKAFAVLLAMGVLAGAMLNTAATPVGTVAVSPASFGAKADGVSDDTRALQAAINAAARGTLQLKNGGVYLVSGPLLVSSKTRIQGLATFKAAPGIEENIGIGGADSLLGFSKGAAGSSLTGLTVDLSGAGRNAVDVLATDMQVEGLSVRNYSKNTKSDGITHGTSESGLRIHASNVRASKISCEDMHTGKADSVPRCISVQGNVTGVSLKAIVGKRLNGGITVGNSTGVTIENYDFRDLSDNGLYLLPGAVGVVATGGYLENTEEPVVFKGSNARVSGLKIRNQGFPIGLENADGVVLEDVQVSFAADFKHRSAFIRTRSKNNSTTHVLLQRVTGKIAMGGSLFALASGSVADFKVRDSTFELFVPAGGSRAPFLVRQKRGEVARIENSTFKFYGPGASQIAKVRIGVPAGAPNLAKFAPGAVFLQNGTTLRAEIAK